MSKADDAAMVPVGAREVRVSHPGKLYFADGLELTKLDLVHYYLAVAPGALGGVRDRPFVLKRFVNGACLPSGQPEPFYQKRAPADRPDWLRTAILSFPSGRTAEEIVIDDAAGLIWVMNLGCIELHPHPVRTADLDHPDELRVDLDPQPGVAWEDVRRVALEVQAVLADAGLVGWVKTSGSRGMHVNVRIEPRWSFTEVRRAALALSRAVERRAPTLATSKWWKEERHGVFLDYNQNAKDRTTCSAYSVRPLRDARVSAPLAWAEVAACEPADFTVLTMPARFLAIGDPHAAMDDKAGSLDGLLELAARDEAGGEADAPWPPHFAKAAGEPKRVQPSKAKAFADQIGEGFGEKRFRKRAVALTAVATDPPRAARDSHTSVGAALSSFADGGGPASVSSPEPSPKRARKPRASTMPLITVAHSPDKAAALAGLDRWRAAHPEAAAQLAEDDVLIDRMRGSAYVWYRIRLNLRHVPEAERPAQATPDPDDDPTRGWAG